MGDVIEMTRKATLEEKIDFIRKQIQDCEAGKLAEIFCPYCGGRNKAGAEKICCILMAKAATAVLDRMQVKDAKTAFENIGERAALVH